MQLFLDTADLDEIRQALDWGVIDGVTTNPSHAARTGRKPAELYPQICEMVDGPVSLETVGLTADDIVREGRILAEMGENVVVKVPVIREGIKAVRILADEGIQTNVTVNFSPTQALLAAKAGATYISPFVGRLDAVGHRGMLLVEQIRKIYDNYGFDTWIITAACRTADHVLQAALIGSDVCTMAFGILDQLFDHPLTDEGVRLFLDDWKKVPEADKLWEQR